MANLNTSSHKCFSDSYHTFVGNRVSKACQIKKKKYHTETFGEQWGIYEVWHVTETDYNVYLNV